ncbi:MAG: anti-sigma F factor antagonist [Bacteroidetes bacterium SW_11_45_7]|jgi:anti-sigma B factor antagonist|nr:MAG: anti-sigma F factor antagonist [Bacteroidetes bacterium SW_11_45_7]
MKITESYQGDILELKIDGELDVNLAVELDDVIKNAIANGYHKVCIDCVDLEYISSAGLGVFVSYMDELTSKEGKFIFYNMNNKVYNVFQILGLQNLMTIVENKEKVQQILDES